MPAQVQIVFDAANPEALGRFWLAALAGHGYVVPDPPGDFADWPSFLAAQGVPEEEFNSAFALELPDGSRPRLFFQRVPEGKAAKNRVHVDIPVSGGHDVPIQTRRERVRAEAARLVELGATSHDEHTELGVFWLVMQDPEGNEFCLT